MVLQKSAYGIIAVLIALLVMTSSLAAYYYSEYEQVSVSNNKLQTELQTASAKYTSLANNYNEVLSTYDGSVTSFTKLTSVYNETSASFLSLSEQFNLTLSLLVSTMSDINTTDSSYLNASRTLSGLWNQYIGITNDYRQLTLSFKAILASFDSENNLTLSENIQSVRVSLLTSSILIYYQNGTADWFNNTSIQPGWNFYVATLVVTNGNVNATWYPQFSEHYVNGINGVMNSNSLNEYWFLWTYNSTMWQVAQVGVDQLMMYNGSTYAWTYCGADANFNPTCTPP